MNFRASFCDPFKTEIIDLGDINEDKIIETFEKIVCTGILRKMENVSSDDIYYSPSLEIENKDNKNGLSISAVGDAANFEFYIFYKRPKMISGFMGLTKKMNENYLSDITEQTTADVSTCLNALMKNDLDFLENKIGK